MTRDEKGRFVKGHAKTGGRQPREVERRYLEVMMGAVSEEDWRDITRRAVQDAIKKGDSTAREWLSKYLIGLPRQPVDLNGTVNIPGLDTVIGLIYGAAKPEP